VTLAGGRGFGPAGSAGVAVLTDYADEGPAQREGGGYGFAGGLDEPPSSTPEVQTFYGEKLTSPAFT